VASTRSTATGARALRQEFLDRVRDRVGVVADVEKVVDAGNFDEPGAGNMSCDMRPPSRSRSCLPFGERRGSAPEPPGRIPLMSI